MPFYKILSSPGGIGVPENYRGLYRREPFPQNEYSKRFVQLWSKYTEAAEKPGITVEMTIEELFELSALAAKHSTEAYEVVCFDYHELQIPLAMFLGIDVVSIGGYSMLGEGLFRLPQSGRLKHIISTLNNFFNKKLNHNGLFSTLADAKQFRLVLEDLQQINNCVEPEAVYSVFIYLLQR